MVYYSTEYTCDHYNSLFNVFNFDSIKYTVEIIKYKYSPIIYVIDIQRTKRNNKILERILDFKNLTLFKSNNKLHTNYYN